MTNFEVIRDMRDAIIYDKIDFKDYCKTFVGGQDRRELGKLWARACSVIKQDQWNHYLLCRASSFLNEFGNALGDLYENGLDCPDIGSMLGIDPKIVRQFL